MSSTTSPAPAVEISLLGGLQIHALGRPLALSARKAQAALAYLAIRLGRPQPREHLQTLLWPEVTKDQAQASLRQTLAALRKGLPARGVGLLETRGHALSLCAGGACVDVQTFDELARAGTQPALERALDLYKGPLLEGFVLGESPFDDWLAAERARLEELALSAFDRLAALQADAGALEAAIQTVQRELSLEPLREPAHRTLMLLYAKQGNRGQALQQYQSCASLLRRELGVEPEAETQRVRQLVLHATALVHRGQALGRDVRCEGGANPLIGRAAEQAQLWRWFAGQSPCARVLIVQGEAGIGKTRLLAALQERVCESGGRCVLARCFVSEHALPFALWATLLRAAAPLAVEPPWRALSVMQRTELGRLLPESAPPAERAPRLEDTHVLFDAVLSVVNELCAAGPLLIVLEDLQWADTPSLQLLSFVARRVPEAAHLRIAISVRSEALSGARTLREVLRELRRERALAQLELSALSRADTLSLLRVALRADSEAQPASDLLGPASVERVWAISEGNPLAITECARSLRRQTAAESADALRVPERVRDVIAEHLSRLDGAALRVLELAAVIGRASSFPLLQRSLGIAEHALARLLVGLVDTHLLTSEGDAFYFTHERIREVVYEQLLAAQQRILHAAVARALEQLHGAALDELVGALAYHWGRAGDAERGVSYLLRYARRCVASYGFEQALTALDQAEREARALPPAAAPTRAVELAIERASCLAQLRRVPEMERCLLPLDPTVDALDSALSGRFHAWLALAQIFLGRTQQAETRARAALRAAERAAQHETAGYAHSLLSLASLRRARFQQGVEHGLCAVERLAADTSDRQIAAFAWLHLAGNQLFTGDAAAALASAGQAGTIAERSASARLSTFVLTLTGMVHCQREEYTTALAAVRAAVARAPDPYGSFFAQLVLVRVSAAAALRTGDAGFLDHDPCPGAIRMLEATLQLGDALGVQTFRGFGLIVLAETHLARGEAGQARARAHAALTVLSEFDDPFSTACGLRVLGRCERALQNPDQGEQHLREACRRFAAMGAALELRATRRLIGEHTPA